MARKVDKEGTQRRREQILKAAGACFADKGFHQSSMVDICKRAKLSPGTVYHYFESKDDFILHFAERELAEAQVFADALSGVVSLEELVELSVDAILKADNLEEMQFYLEVLGEGGRNPKVGRVLTHADEVVYTALRKQLRRLKVKGEASLGMLTLFVMSLLGGLELFKLEKPSPKECLEMSRLSRKALLHVLSGDN